MAKPQKSKLYPKITLKRLIDINSPEFEKRVAEIARKAINEQKLVSHQLRNIIRKYA